MSTVKEIKAAIETLPPAKRKELARWIRRPTAPRRAQFIPVRESKLNPEEDSPELEAELLKAAGGPFTPYSRRELETIAERVLREKARR